MPGASLSRGPAMQTTPVLPDADADTPRRGRCRRFRRDRQRERVGQAHAHERWHARFRSNSGHDCRAGPSGSRCRARSIQCVEQDRRAGSLATSDRAQAARAARCMSSAQPPLGHHPPQGMPFSIAASSAARSTPVWPPERIFTMRASIARKKMQIEAKSFRRSSPSLVTVQPSNQRGGSHHGEER